MQTVLMPDLTDLLVERIHQLLVVEPPVGLRLGGEERIADGVALPAIGLDGGDAAVHLVHPARALGREDRVAEQAPRAAILLMDCAGHRDLVVAQEIPRLVVEGRAREQRHLRVAVDEDLLDVVLELVAGQRVLAPEGRVPVLLGVLGEVEQAVLVEVVAHEVGLGVDDELLGERARPAGSPRPASGPRPALTSKTGPNTSFMARKAAAMPALDARNWRRFIPCRGPRSSASSLMRASTRCCSRVWGSGLNSPLETIWVGTGEANAATSAGAVRVSSSSLR